ncbi:DMT family transporter [Tabrizicola oligotrophica]|uniref:DMT family transporter n=1 Tax=Tabrizicola oligotrophica TaxID=2710650 RepID=A0A6M0QSL1_9RHOB|nr:DMT family transporter [Tabrizicola oligotrophica]NEY89981.1 DMT family transporter [Tabrizicola oligotrophica]
MTALRPSLPVFLGLALALLVAWSSGFVGIRFTHEVATVPQILFARSLCSGLGLLPFLIGPWAKGPKIGARDVTEQGLYAFLGMFLYLGGFAMGIGAGVPTGLVALMADLVPLGIAALSAPLLGQRLTPRQWLGTAIACAGVLAVSADALALGAAPVWAYALPILGMLAFAVSTVLQERRGGSRLTIPQRLGLQCLWAAVFFAPFAAAGGGLFPAITPDYVLGIGWLVVLATYGGWLIYYLFLRLYPPAMVSAVVYLSPPVTMVWAFALFGEPLTWRMALGLLVTLCGVALVAGRKT